MTRGRNGRTSSKMIPKSGQWRACLVALLAGFQLCSVAGAAVYLEDDATKNREEAEAITAEELKLIRAVEDARIAVIEKVVGSVVAIYGSDRQGGGSGVIIDPSGIALTNHHVIMGAGIKGWGGLDDGKLYRWDLIGTDPGGDVAIIQMKGQESFPFSPLGDSDKVQIGDWALAMGNPFLLAEDQVPTVTLGIVSGVKRYQYGAGRNQLVYGNCIQVDSSINPGNSGGALFNMQGEVIGINGRGSFRDRGRVNVGLGYAISSNQIKNFIPDLLATKLVEHGTLDASFSDRDGRVVCSKINLDAPVALAGLELGDRLIQFEDQPISSANQFTNLICTLPEDWPARLLIEKSDGRRLAINVRLFGLPYAKPRMPRRQQREGEPSPEEKRRRQKTKEMIALLSAEPGTIRNESVNRGYANDLLESWKKFTCPNAELPRGKVIHVVDNIQQDGKRVGTHEMWLSFDGRFRIRWDREDEQETFVFDGESFWKETDEGSSRLTMTEAKLNPVITQAVCLANFDDDGPLSVFGRALLDGSDKAAGKTAYRIKFLDEDDDWFYIWLSMYDDEGRQQIRLVRSSSELDLDKNGGWFLLEDWREHEGVRVPHRRSLVSGLVEKIELELLTAEVELVASDDALFETKTESTD